MQHTIELLDSLGTVHSLYGDIALEFTEQTEVTYYRIIG